MSYSVADLQSVHRAIADLRRGAAVLCRNNDGTSALIAAAEQVSASSLNTRAAGIVLTLFAYQPKPRPCHWPDPEEGHGSLLDPDP